MTRAIKPLSVVVAALLLAGVAGFTLTGRAAERRA